MTFRLWLIGVLPLLLIACSDSSEQAEQTVSALPEYARWYKPEQVVSGAELFKVNCAICHGFHAQGAKDWQKSGADGKFPAPPLNSTGHGWHHPLPILFSVIKNGSPGGQGNMPAWRDKLTESQILNAVAWFQSLWPEEIYQAWARRDAAARAKE